MKPWPLRHFDADELVKPERAEACSAGAWACIGALGAAILDPLRAAHGHPLRVTSGYRDPAANRAAGGSSTSQHVLGQAADIQSDHATPDELARLVVALGLPFDQLIVESRPGGAAWLHVSYGPRHRREALSCTDGETYTPWRPHGP